MTPFDHERLDVYQTALQFAGDAFLLAQDLPRGRMILGDQLRRAATSVCLNIAEGSGEFTPKEKARFYRMAKRSATECAAVLDVGVRWLPSGADKTFIARVEEGKQMLRQVVSMLVRMIRNLEMTT